MAFSTLKFLKKAVFKKIKKAFNPILALVVTSFPALVFAHPGHSAEGSLMHSFEHGVWAIAVLALVGIFYAVALFAKSLASNKN